MNEHVFLAKTSAFTHVMNEHVFLAKTSAFTHVMNEHVFLAKTKENVCIRIGFNSQRISRGHQHGRRPFV